MAGGETTPEKEIIMKVIYFLSVFLFSVLLSACAAIRGGGGRRPGKTGAAGGQLSVRPPLFSGSRASRPQLYVRYGATGRSLELFGQSPIPHRQLCASAPDFAESTFPAQEQQSRTVIPWPCVVSSRRPKGGAAEYPTRYERN